MVDVDAQPNWVKAQMKAFTGWCNVQLVQKNPDLKINDVSTELMDGTRLIVLLECLEGISLAPYNKPPCKLKFHKLENMNKVFDHLKSRGFNLTGIQASSLVDGSDFKGLLGLLWHLILKYQINKVSPDEPQSTSAAKGPSPKDALRQWVRDQVADYGSDNGTLSKGGGDPLPVKNLTNSFGDGLVFCALVDSIKPGSIEVGKISAANKQENLSVAFTTAESQLGIPQLIDAELAATGELEEHSVMTYLSFFRDAANGSGRPATPTPMQDAKADEEDEEHKHVDIKEEIAQLRDEFERDLAAATAALEEERKATASFVDPKAAPAPMMGLDRSGAITAWNPALGNLLGFSEDEVVGKPFTDTYIREDDRDRMNTAFDAAFGGDSPDVDVGVLKKGGNVVDMLLSLAPQRARSGSVVYTGDDKDAADTDEPPITGLLIVGQDISDIKKGAGAQGADLVNLVGAVVIALDDQGTIVEWNSAAENITSVQKSDALGRNFVADFIADDQQEAVSAVVTAAIEDTVTKQDYSLFTSPLKDANGDIYLSAVPRIDRSTGKKSGCVITLQDTNAFQLQEMKGAVTEDEVLKDWVDQSSTGLFALDKDGNVTQWNKAAEEATGFPSGSVVGQAFADKCVVRDADKSAFDAAVKQILAMTGPVNTQDVREKFQLHLVLGDASNAGDSAAVTSGLDNTNNALVVTWPKRSNDETVGVWCAVFNLSAVLENARFHCQYCSSVLVEAAADDFSQLPIVNTNSTVQDQLGYTQAELLSKTLGDVASPDYQQYLPVIMKAVAAGTTGTVQIGAGTDDEVILGAVDDDGLGEFEVPLVLKDGTVSTYLLRLKPYQPASADSKDNVDADAKPRYEVVFQDITGVQQRQRSRDAEVQEYEVKAAREDALAEAAIEIDELKKSLDDENKRRLLAEKELAMRLEADKAGNDAQEKLMEEIKRKDQKNLELLEKLKAFTQEMKEMEERLQAFEIEKKNQASLEEAATAALQRVKSAGQLDDASAVDKDDDEDDEMKVGDWRPQDNQAAASRFGYSGKLVAHRPSVWERLDNLVHDIQEEEEQDLKAKLKKSSSTTSTTSSSSTGRRRRKAGGGKANQPSVEELLAQFLNNAGQMAIDLEKAGNKGEYIFGTRKIHLVVVNGKLMVRVGGGFSTIEDFVAKNGPAEARKMKARLEKQGAKQRKKGDGYTTTSVKKRYR